MNARPGNCIFIVDTNPEGDVRARVQKWGNSLALRIPRPVAEELRVREGSELEMSLEEGALVLRPRPALTYDLEALLSRITPENLHGEAEAGPAVGGEAW